MSYYGNGAWSWNDSYELPIHIRRYCLKLLQQAKEKEQQEMEKSQNPEDSDGSTAKIPKTVYNAINTDKKIERRTPK